MNRAVCLVLAASVIGCVAREPKPVVPCTVSAVVRKVRHAPIDKVDLLFVIDNSGSMAEEQASLAEQIPRLVRVLASGDTDGDGMQNFPPVRSLHVGVVTTDMGTGGFPVPTCSEPNFGDDGILITSGNTARPGCMATYPAYQAFEPMTGDPDQLANDVTCVAAMGTGGCGFEQQLEASIKALVPSTAGLNPPFVMGSVGHGDRENAGFLRPDSLLVVLMLTDEEDCSAMDPGLFDPMSATYTGDLNLRCFMYPGAVHPVSRFADALLSLRAGNPDLLIFSAITGVPPECVNDEGDNYDEILDPVRCARMIQQPDPDSPTPRLVPSCNLPGRGIAFPPRRIVELAKQLHDRGANGVIQSICTDDFTPAIDAVIEKFEDVLGGACLPRPLVRDAGGTVSCDIVYSLPATGDVTRCDQLVAADPVPVRFEADGRQVCAIQQLAVTGGTAPPGEGWFYDDFSEDVMARCTMRPHRISFSSGAVPPTGAEVRLECLQPVSVVLGASAEIGIGTPCATDTAICGRTAMAGLACDIGDGATNTCQVSCTSDSQCPASFVCDTGRTDGMGPICLNPTCGS